MTAFLRATRSLLSRPAATRTPLSTTFFQSTQPGLPRTHSPTWPSTLRLRSHNARPPPPPPNRRQSLSPLTIKNGLIYSLIGVNTAIFAYAWWAREQAKAGHYPRLMSFMRNMTMNYTDVVERGMWWQAVTSVFTHTSPFHFLGNMVSFYYLGSFLVETPFITAPAFLALVIGSGIAGSTWYLYNRKQVLGQHGIPDNSRGLGFSGAIMGVSAVAACLYPRVKVNLYGVVPVPLWGLTLGYALYDGYYLNSTNTRTAHAGHLGGLAFGLAFYLLKLRTGRVF